MKYVLFVSVLVWGMSAYAETAPHQNWTLSAVLQRVGESNREVLAARRAVDAARADQVGASVTPPAQFSLLSQSIDTRNLGNGSLWNRPVDTIARIDKTLERGGKAELRERGAQAGLAAAHFNEIDALRSQSLMAAQAYWDLKLAQEQLAITEHNWRLSQESSRSAQLRLKQGDLSRLEATRLAVEEDRAANEHAQARKQLTQARMALSQALALQDAPAIQASDAWPDSSVNGRLQVKPQGLQNEALQDESWLSSRADVMGAKQRLAQAQAALALAEAQRKADLTVTIQFEHNPSVANRLWGVGMAFPLGVDGRQEGPVARALVAVDDARAQLEKVRATALSDRALQRDALSTAL